MTRWRLAAPIDDIRVPMAAVLASHTRFAIATLVEITGSAPRDVGAQMLVAGDEYWGFLSGGCIEADVARHAREAMDEGRARLLRYGDGSPWIDIKLACGSGITVLVEPIAAGDPAAAALLDAWSARRPVSWSSDGTARTVRPADDVPCADMWDTTHYTRLFAPPLRLVLVGEDGAALAGAALALEMGWEAALITPGGPDTAPFPGMTYYRTAAPSALADIAIDRWTAIAVLSHDREDDEQGLAAALTSDAFYVGAIGARTRLEGRRERLRGHGVSDAQLARLHAPIGLHGFGKAPRDVALSLVAQVAQAFHACSAAARSPGASISSSAPASAVSR